MTKIVTVAVILFLGFLVANKAVLHANAGEKGATPCTKAAEMARQSSLKNGFSEEGARSQAENARVRCLIDG